MMNQLHVSTNWIRDTYSSLIFETSRDNIHFLQLISSEEDCLISGCPRAAKLGSGHHLSPEGPPVRDTAELWEWEGSHYRFIQPDDGEDHRNENRTSEGGWQVCYFDETLSILKSSCIHEIMWSSFSSIYNSTWHGFYQGLVYWLRLLLQ